MPTNEIVHKIQDRMRQVGYKAKTVSITHLSEVQEAVGKLVRQGLLNKQLHERWHFYLKTNENLPEAKTIIVVAMPQPFTRLRFEWQGMTYLADIPPTYFTKADDYRAEVILHNVLETTGYKIAKAHLALKTLAVRSGLARYGKNNISYVSRMGSFCQLVAFYSDCPCEKDNWQELKEMEACEKCSLCRESCPTGSISVDRFLIHAENCLGSLNERKPDFPYWVQLQPDWRNALIGCMRCQFVCPVDKPYLHKIVAGLSFSEEETGLILNKTPWEKLSPNTRQKLGDLYGVYSLLSRNLSALIEKQRKTI
ncbi:MAG: 4Fe-4S double cluster binding domain-containing protein [Chloroflexota bacterium]